MIRFISGKYVKNKDSCIKLYYLSEEHAMHHWILLTSTNERCEKRENSTRRQSIKMKKKNPCNLPKRWAKSFIIGEQSRLEDSKRNL